MKSGYLLAPLVVAMTVAFCVPTAVAQPYPQDPSQNSQQQPPDSDGPPPPNMDQPPPYSQQPPPPRPYGRNVPRPVSFGYANVLRVTPVYGGGMQQVCDGVAPVQKDTSGGTILGAIIGGAIGNTVGRGNGRAAATVGGAVVGGAIGHDVAQNSGPNYVPAGCHMVETGGNGGPPAGFDVEYDYKGDVYVARMPYDPGNRIRVRVSVVPAEMGPPPPPYGR